MNSDEKEGAIFVVGLILAYIIHKTNLISILSRSPEPSFADALGIISILVGVPFFLYIIFKKRIRRWMERHGI